MPGRPIVLESEERRRVELVKLCERCSMLVSECRLVAGEQLRSVRLALPDMVMDRLVVPLLFVTSAAVLLLCCLGGRLGMLCVAFDGNKSTQRK